MEQWSNEAISRGAMGQRTANDGCSSANVSQQKRQGRGNGRVSLSVEVTPANGAASAWRFGGMGGPCPARPSCRRGPGPQSRRCALCLHSALCTLHMLWPDLLAPLAPLALPLLCPVCVSCVSCVSAAPFVPSLSRHLPSTPTAVWPTCHRSPHNPPCPRLTRQQRWHRGLPFPPYMPDSASTAHSAPLIA
jgi:hypothetical protein